VDTERIDVRREPLVVRDGCAPGRIPAGRWPSDETLVRSEQFAVNEAIARLPEGGQEGGLPEGESTDWVFGVHAPPGTGVAEVFGDLVAAIVTERARRIAALPDPAAAFGEPRTWGAHTVTEPAAELAGFEIVLTGPDPGAGPLRPGPGLPPIGSAWRDRAARADYFASTARLADGVGAWAMLAARLGDGPANRAFADRWWHGAVRGADVLFPAGESMAAALRRLKGTTVYWPACVSWFRSAIERVRSLAAERMEVASALTRLSLLEQACEEASLAAEAARGALADLVACEPAAREAVTSAEEAYRAALATLGAHDLGRPELATMTPQGVAALRSRRALSVALAGGMRRGRNMRSWSIVHRELRAACVAAERIWEEALRGAETLRAHVAAARSAVDDRVTALSRLTAEMEPLATAVAAARQRWGDCVPVGPSQAETEDPALIEWRESSAPWADEEYVRARAEAFIAALELHKALIVTQADVFEANLAALMELIAADPGLPDDTAAGPAPADHTGAGRTEAGHAELAGLRLAAWRSFFLVVPAVHAAFEAAGPLFGGLGASSLGWLLTADADQLAAEDVPGLLDCFRRAVFAGDTVLAPPTQELADTVGIPVPAQATAQDLADRVVRYGTWLPTGPAAGHSDAKHGDAKHGDAKHGDAKHGDTKHGDEAEQHWVGMPLRVVRGQDRATVDRRNDLAYDGLLVSERELARQAAGGPLHDRDVARGLRLGAAGRVVVDRVGLQVHDEDVDDRVRRRVQPGDVDLVVTDRERHVVLGRERHADVRSGDRGAEDRAARVRLLEGVAGVAAECVLGVDHETGEVESVQADRCLVARRAGTRAGRGGGDGGAAGEQRRGRGGGEA